LETAFSSLYPLRSKLLGSKQEFLAIPYQDFCIGLGIETGFSFFSLFNRPLSLDSNMPG